ncbi:ESPR-type extended signal peptide-containing protein [Burkholderia metallica]|uniref:ESPR-type extended signal peptide-containing protein n=1 Tax=Burkholderia metallica TaxID=488729 RepID=UPI001453DBE3|nr:ESPR-type extended signal peptide-containing protein [Burkholderia metallica]VWB96364.1 putative hemagglutinin-related autotransporter protein [Burkholderia metallica]
MNKTYRNIWNTATGTWTAVAETARSRSKGSARAARQAVAVLALGGASIGGAFAADACTTEDGVSGSLDAAGVCKVTASRTIGTDAIGTTATLTDNYFKVNSTSANLAAATGANAVAIGQAVTSSGSSSVAIGSGTSADGLHSMALGASSSVIGDSNLAVGDGATVSRMTYTPTNAVAIGMGARVTDGGVNGATGSIAIGNGAAAAGSGSIMIGTSTRHSGSGATVVGANASAMGGGAGVAMGASSSAAGSASVAMGPNATATGLGSIAIGNQAVTANNNAVALGNGAAGSVVNATAIGSNAQATGTNATVLGQSSSASGLSAVGIGFRANAQADNSVALGVDSVANRNNTVSVGSATQQRQVVNVAAGTQATDAVNVSQLQPAVTALGGGAAINPTTGAVTGPTYTLTNGGTQTTVGGALGALDSALATANGNIARNTGDITTINSKLATVVTDDYVKVDTTSGATPAQVSTSALAVGANARGTGDRATAVGNNSIASGANSSVFGMGATASGAASTTIGAYASATGYHASALGVGAIASGSESVAIGTSSNADRDNSVSVGSSTLQRQITNMAAGTQGTDAVNVSQLSPVVAALGGGATIDSSTGTVTGPTYTLTNGGAQTTVGGALGALDGALTTANGNIARNTGDITTINTKLDGLSNGTVGLVQQAAAGDDLTVGAHTDGAAVDFTGTAGARKLTGVDAGAVSVSSKDAVNGSQLHGVADSVASAIGGGSVVNTDGSISAPSFTLGDGTGGSTTVRSVGGAVANLDGRVTTNEGDIASLADQIGSGTVGLVQQASAGADITVGANTDGAAVDFTGTAGARKLTGVDAGAVSVSSKDAVNGSQLHGVADSVASAIGGGSVVNTDGSISAPSFTLGDGTGGSTTVRSVGGAVANLDGRVTTNEGDIASLADQIGSGTVGLVQQASAGADITVGANTDGAAVDFTGTAGARKLTGVDAGTISASSTDAVNGSQLHGVADSVASAIGGGSVVNTDGSISAPSFTVGDGSGGSTTVRSVGGAVANLDGRVTTNEGAIASLADQIGGGTVGLVQQAGAGADITVGANTDGAAVNFTGTAGARKLTGIDAGVVSASSTDAVNGSQLHGVADSVASAIGGGSVVNADGSISAPSFTVGDGHGGSTTVRSVGDAVTNLDGRVTTNEGDIASLADQIGSGTVGLVQQAGAGADITVGANTDGAAVNFAGTAGARKLTGVDAGAVSASSTDAVNGSQLHGVADSVASAIGGGSVVNADGSISAPSFTVGDGSGGSTTVHSVGDVVTNLDGRVTTNEGAVASLADQIGSGTLGLVQQAGPGANLTVGANTDGTAVSFVGTAGARKLSGVANGVNDDDAVTIAQLKATGLIDYTGREIAAVTYDDISLASVTFGGSAGTRLLNVAPGLIAAGSMEAVNGSQLYDLQERFAQEYARLDGRVGDLEAGGGSGGGGGGGGGNVGPGTGGEGSLVVGDGSAASGENSSAIGQGSAASGSGSTAVGQGSNASGSNSSAIGQGAVASGDSSTAIGQGSKATGSGSVAIGAGSVATEANTVSFGDGTAEGNRRLVNIADGVNASDAATKGQLDRAINGMQGQINDVAKNAYAGVAAAMAMPNLTPSQPGKTVVAAGAANYKSGSAIAAGATYRTRDGKWLMNGAVSVTSTGDAGVRAQVGYEF